MQQHDFYILLQKILAIEPIRPVPITATVKSLIERDNIDGSHLKS